MVKRLIFVALASFLTNTSVAAQSPFGDNPNDPQNWFKLGCPRCGVVAYLDLPSFGDTISRTNLLLGNVQFQGWGFECVSGQPLSRVDVWVETDRLQSDGTFAWEAVKRTDGLGYYPIARPDVAAAFARSCPNVSPTTGWSVRMTSVPDWMIGARRIALVAWNGPFHTAMLRTYNITP